MDSSRLGRAQGAADDGVHEARLVRAEDPGDADHAVRWAGREDLAVSLELGHAIVAEGTRFVLFCVRSVERPVKDVIGADMHEPGPACGAKPGDATGRDGIDRAGLVAVALAPVDVGGGGAVDHHVAGAERSGGETFLRPCGIGKVDQGPGQGNDREMRKPTPSAREGRAETTVGTEDDDFHRQGTLGFETTVNMEAIRSRWKMELRKK